jgi:hypothetical protein
MHRTRKQHVFVMLVVYLRSLRLYFVPRIRPNSKKRCTMNTREEADLWHALCCLETRYWHEVDSNGGLNAHEFYRPDGLMVVGHNRLVDFQEVCQMDANSGEPWSEMDIKDLRASLDFGNTYADAASMLCRDEDEVRQKAKELGLVERQKKW